MENRTVANVKSVKPRRSHFKSRNGCLYCKQRRVKCDERHPICGPCAKRQLPCEFKPRQYHSSSSSNYSENSPGKSFSQLQSVSTVSFQSEDIRLGSNESTRVLELKLFHHFSTATYRTIAILSLDYSLLQVKIPNLALSYSFLLEIMFALSALHLESLERSENKMWLRIGLYYQNKSLQSFNRILPEINAENCSALACCSIFNKLASVAIPALCDDDSSQQNLTHEYLSTIKISEEILNIMITYEEELKNGPIKDYFIPIYESDISRIARIKREAKNGEDICFLPDQVELYFNILNSLERLIIYIEENPTPKQELYINSCKILWTCMKPLSNCVLVTCSCNWPMIIDLNAMEPIKGNIISRMIFLHYGAVLHLINDRWFAQGSGRRMVKSMISGIGEVFPDVLKNMINFICDAVLK
ncbi:putative c6 zinc finger domain protein [Golovinomyces cichoracearum]|uniref:Putative c6 zinc finger domain protein n=1 Tax=Golovinomyces cichoracearum TaxID=62708 RepID=A0A420I120_9PEZI|nr:putative c6 zinc finger domain protein [Golovinomyces cichoracearum]